MADPPSDAGIDNTRKHIGKQIASEHEDRTEERDAHEKRGVAAQTRRDGRLPQPGIGKHLLDQDRTARVATR